MNTLTTIVVANATPTQVIGALDKLGVSGATVWGGFGYGLGYPTEPVTVIRASFLGGGRATSFSRSLAVYFGEETVYLEIGDLAWIVYASGQPNDPV